MRVYINNQTGNLCLLTWINTDYGYQMEYLEGWIKYKVNTKLISVEDKLEEDFTEIGYL